MLAGLLPAAPLADASDRQAAATLCAILQDPTGAGVGAALVESFVHSLLPGTAGTARRFRGLPQRPRVPVAAPYVMSLEELAARASWRVPDPDAPASVFGQAGTRAQEAARAAEQVARRLPTAEPQRSWARQPIAVPGTPWGECARRVVWERAVSSARRPRRWVPAATPTAA